MIDTKRLAFQMAKLLNKGGTSFFACGPPSPSLANFRAEGPFLEEHPDVNVVVDIPVSLMPWPISAWQDETSWKLAAILSIGLIKAGVLRHFEASEGMPDGMKNPLFHVTLGKIDMRTKDEAGHPRAEAESEPA